MNSYALKRSFIGISSHSPRIPGWVARYGIAITSGLVALGLSRWINPAVYDYLFDVFQGAVVISSWYGGLGPGLLTSAISILAIDYYFIPPVHTFRVGLNDIGRLFVFGIVAILTSSLSNQLKEAKKEIEASHEKLEERIARRTKELLEANANLKAEIAHRLEAEKAILEISNREQRRLGQDLHDGLCQMLVGVKFMAEELKEKLSKLGRPETSDAGTIELRLSDALAQADNVSRGLYPVELETDGLTSALHALASGVMKASPVSCQFKCAKPVTLADSSVATHLYRMAQEAAANAVKSGKAKRIRIRLIQRARETILSVTDDGIGMFGHSLRKGMGLKIMEYRARMINGQLQFRSHRGGCTRMSCRFLANPEVSTNAG
jgi:signal transduction histidine kinase